VAEVDGVRRPSFFPFPSVGQYASASSSVEDVDAESFHSSTDAHASYVLGNSLSNLGLHQHRNLEHCYNNPNPDYNTVSDTNDHPINATTNHPRKTSLQLYQEQRKHHLYQASQSHLEVPQIGQVVVRCLNLHHNSHQNLVLKRRNSSGEIGTTLRLFPAIAIFSSFFPLFFLPDVFEFTPLKQRSFALYPK